MQKMLLMPWLKSTSIKKEYKERKIKSMLKVS